MPEPGKHTLTEQLPVQHREQADSPRPSAAAIPTSAPVPSAQSSIPLQMLFGARPALGDGAGGGNGHASRSDGGGKAMPAAVQAKMAHALGMDFSAVQIHEGPGAGALGARAYTQGNDVHFAPGEYQPGSQAGQMLLGHDLAHVVQQRQGRVQATTQAKGVAVNDDAGLEREATRWGRGRRAASERMPGPRQRPMAPVPGAAQRSTSGIVQRVKWDEWPDHMKDVAPGTQSKAKLGMCIVNWLRERVGVNARIGGSLSAAMFGGRRVPRDIDIDIDIDIPGKVVELNEARGRFFDLIKRPNFALATGTDLFFLVGWAKTPEGFEIAYHQVQTKTAIDPMDDESEVEKILKQTHAPVSKVSVDFSSETAFSSSGIHRGDCRPSGHRPSR